MKFEMRSLGWLASLAIFSVALGCANAHNKKEEPKGDPVTMMQTLFPALSPDKEYSATNVEINNVRANRKSSLVRLINYLNAVASVAQERKLGFRMFLTDSNTKSSQDRLQFTNDGQKTSLIGTATSNDKVTWKYLKTNVLTFEAITTKDGKDGDIVFYGSDGKQEEMSLTWRSVTDDDARVVKVSIQNLKNSGSLSYLFRDGTAKTEPTVSVTGTTGSAPFRAMWTGQAGYVESDTEKRACWAVKGESYDDAACAN